MIFCVTEWKFSLQLSFHMVLSEERWSIEYEIVSSMDITYGELKVSETSHTVSLFEKFYVWELCKHEVVLEMKTFK